MDPAHSDRVTFVRMCSRRFVRDMKLMICHSGKEIRTNTEASFN